MLENVFKKTFDISRNCALCFKDASWWSWYMSLNLLRLKFKIKILFQRNKVQCSSVLWAKETTQPAPVSALNVLTSDAFVYFNTNDRDDDIQLYMMVMVMIEEHVDNVEKEVTTVMLVTLMKLIMIFKMMMMMMMTMTVTTTTMMMMMMTSEQRRHSVS